MLTFRGFRHAASPQCRLPRQSVPPVQDMRRRARTVPFRRRVKKPETQFARKNKNI